MYGSGFLRLPEGKSARAVVKDYLQELYQFLVQSIEKDIGREVLNTMPMECWITIPAIWSDRAQADTRAAALEAGFGSRKSDKVNVIPEPEAGALYALKPYLGERAVNPIKVSNYRSPFDSLTADDQAGEHFLICDCGGGTVVCDDMATDRSEPQS
jgi:molecular chaperone DnaK (HSP70)